MPTEIERKYLVRDDTWQNGSVGVRISQGYLAKDADRTVRVRVAGETGWLTIKGRSVGIRRAEYEYEIPLAEARELLEMCLPGVIDKTRHRISYKGHDWEIDVFHADNDGLIVAEVELEDESIFPELPLWVGDEVSADSRYFNSALAVRPYCTW